MKKEAMARIKINELLKEANWRFFDDEKGVANISLERNVKLTKHDFNELGEDFEKISNGFIDFLLLDENSKPYIVLEAKSEDKDPLVGKEQAREYAQSIGVKYVILSNGNQHYFWNIYKGNPQIITSFPSCDSLKESKALNADATKLFNEEISEDYIAVVKNPRYMDSPEYINKETRINFLINNGIRMLRPYQINALKALQESVKQGNQRFLFEMATGTGKTLTSAAVIRLFLRTGNANRILFLVDRIELENQAKKNFDRYLSPDYQTVIFKENQDSWKSAEVVVSTVQTLMTNNKYKKHFMPTDFSLIIADESHRSINGNNRAVFEYFLGYKLGLTATPKDYLKNVNLDKLKNNDIRSWERRQLLDSYKTFGCESGEPTFRYSLLDGVKDGYLINPTVVDARTDITTKLLAEEGYSVLNQTDENEDEESIYYAKDFEKKFFSEETNKVLIKTFLENALRDPITNEIGKSIIFCVSRKHAAKITQILNVMADKMFPNMYQSDFAMQITSDVMNSQTYTINFQNNNLSGYSKTSEIYKTSKTRVCVTVGMMTTGYDCEDILNIGLLRPIFSPTDFVQIKGRGTRKFTFKCKSIDTSIVKEKNTFKLFDFFGNCEYFEEKFNYDEVLKIQKVYGKETGTLPLLVLNEPYENYNLDPIKTITENIIGIDGMKIDRMYFEKFEDLVKGNNEVKNIYEQGNYEQAIDYLDKKVMNKPNEFYTWDKLKRAVGSDRKVTVREILDKVFGKINFIKNKQQLADDEFENFTLVRTVQSEKYLLVKHFFYAYLMDKELRRAIEDNNYQALGTEVTTFTLNEAKQLGKESMILIAEYINDNVNVMKYA